MKKHFGILACAILASIFLLTSCLDKHSNDNITEEINVATIESAEIETQSEPRPWTGGDTLKNDFPTVDGSTSLIPLDVGVYSAVFGISRGEAEKKVSHSKSWNSFYRLLKGECDVLLSVPLSDEQLRIAEEEYQIELEFTPIAYEGFVFIVNINNPVNSLTQQQIKDIYSGKITNWKEIGGNDEPIIAYQRNADSGSQNYMIDFMGDTEPMYAPAEYIPGTMGGLIELVASYDNSKQAIGYSVYTYAADMYESGNNIKFIAVDGIIPNKTSMGNGTYPLVSYNYAIINKTSPADSSARKLIEYLLSDDGQNIIAESGYVPIRNTRNTINVQLSPIYAAKGTGADAPTEEAVYTYYYTASLLHLSNDAPGRGYTYNEDKDIDYEYDNPAYYKDLYTITGLKDKTLAAEIEKFIYGSIDELCSAEAIKQNKEFLKKSQPYGTRLPVQVKEVCRNGYYSIGVFSEYNSGADYPDGMFFDCRTVTYDLYTGKKLEFSDLFYKGADFVAELNNALSTDLSYGLTPYGILSRRITDIVVLKSPIDKFMADSICLPAGNDIYNEGANVLIPQQVYNHFVLLEPRDMSELFDADVAVMKSYYSYNTYEIGGEGVKIYDSGRDMMIQYWKVAECKFIAKEVADKVNAYIENIISKYFTYESVEKILQEQNIEYTSFGLYFDSSYGIMAGKYIDLFTRAEIHYTDSSDNYYRISPSIDEFPQFYSYWNRIYFNIDTGEPLTYDDLFTDGWASSIGKLAGKNIDDYGIFWIENYNVDYYQDEYELANPAKVPLRMRLFDKSDPENEKKYIEIAVPRAYLK